MAGMTATQDHPTEHATALPGFVVVMLGVAATLASLFLLRQFSGFAGPLFLALNLVIAAYPVHRWLVSKGTPAWLAASVMALTVIVILLVAVAGLVGTVNSLVTELTKPKYTVQYQTLYHNLTVFLGGFNINIDNLGLADVVAKINPSTVTGAITTVFSSATGILGIVSVIVLSLIFLAMDAPSYDRRQRLAAIASPRVSRAMENFTHGVRRYWIVTTVFGLIVAVLDGGALAILGIPLPVAWALLSFVTNYIPNIGFFIGAAPPMLLALFIGGWKLAVAVLVIYSVLNIVIQTIIQPRFTGKSVGVTVTVSFVSLLLWGVVLGPLGTLLALPMTLFVKALLVDVDPKARWLNALIASDPGSALDAPPDPQTEEA